VAAHDNLYCQRTHFSPAEQKKRERGDPHQRAVDAVPPVADHGNMMARTKRLIDIAAIRLMQKSEMKERWAAGEFDHLYGPYRPKGVLLKPPPKIYVERLERDGA
jgi:hypothetical protein